MNLSHSMSPLFFSPQYNVVKKWLEVEIAPDIRGRIPLLLTSLSFKVSVLEMLEEKPRLLSLAPCLLCVHCGIRNRVLIQGLLWEILAVET